MPCRSIALHDFRVEGRAQIPIRHALLFYAFERLSLDTDQVARRLWDQLIVPFNRVLGDRNNFTPPREGTPSAASFD